MKDVHILRKGHTFKESQQDVRQGGESGLTPFTESSGFIEAKCRLWAGGSTVSM